MSDIFKDGSVPFPDYDREDTDNFTRKVLPYLEEDYFTDRSERLVYKQITEYFMKYNECPTHEALNIQLNDLSGHNDEEIKNAQNIINACKENSEETPHDFLVDETEKWCKEIALYLELMIYLSFDPDEIFWEAECILLLLDNRLDEEILKLVQQI